jgi:hypothetical protein
LIQTDLSKLTDDDIRIVQHHYAEVMSNPELLIRYTAAKGVKHGLTEIYADCAYAIRELGDELKRRGTR